MNTRELLRRKQWKKIRPSALPGYDGVSGDVSDDSLAYVSLNEADFLREYYPSGHIINSAAYYPDIYREVWEDVIDEEGNPTGKKVRRVYKECVPRYAFAYEQIIALKQTIHLTGNDIQCDLAVTKPTKEQSKDYEAVRQGWLMKDMEMRFFECVRDCKIVANVAFVGYMDNKKFGTKTLSFRKGDTLYPHYDPLTGKLKVFARRFSDYDDEGAEMTQWLEVWDDTYFYRYKRNVGGAKSVSDVILGIFRVDGWQSVDKKKHGFPFVPVAYHRDDDGPAWAASRDSIDSFDLSFSQMAHNNEAYGEPILVLQNDGEDIDIQHGLNGTIKTLSMNTESKASYLEGQSASESYHRQLDMLYKMIYEQSFTVIPPEMRSGDLPGVALKLLYSPAYEKAMADAQGWQGFLNDMAMIFLYGYGMEMEKSIDFTTLPLKWWIKPYIHINESAIVTDLATSVQNGFISKQTASERNAAYSSVAEWERIIKEAKEEQQADLLYQIKTKAATSDNNQGDDGVQTK